MKIEDKCFIIEIINILIEQLKDLFKFMIFFISKVKNFFLHIVFIFLCIYIASRETNIPAEIITAIALSIIASIIFESYKNYRQILNRATIIKTIRANYTMYSFKIMTDILDVNEVSQKFFTETLGDINSPINLAILPNLGGLDEIIKILNLANTKLTEANIKSDYYMASCDYYAILREKILEYLPEFFEKNIASIQSLDYNEKRITYFLQLQHQVVMLTLLQFNYRADSIQLRFDFIIEILNMMVKCNKEIE